MALMSMSTRNRYHLHDRKKYEMTNKYTIDISVHDLDIYGSDANVNNETDNLFMWVTIMKYPWSSHRFLIMWTQLRYLWLWCQGQQKQTLSLCKEWWWDIYKVYNRFLITWLTYLWLWCQCQQWNRHPLHVSNNYEISMKFS